MVAGKAHKSYGSAVLARVVKFQRTPCCLGDPTKDDILANGVQCISLYTARYLLLEVVLPHAFFVLRSSFFVLRSSFFVLHASRPGSNGFFRESLICVLGSWTERSQPHRSCTAIDGRLHVGVHSSAA